LVIGPPAELEVWGPEEGTEGRLAALEKTIVLIYGHTAVAELRLITCFEAGIRGAKLITYARGYPADWAKPKESHKTTPL